MDAWVQIVVALVALGGPAFAYLAAVRKTAGRIRSSDATELWDEARALRTECAERVKVLEATVERQQSEIYRLQRNVMGGGEA